MAVVLLWHIKNQTKRQDCRRSGGGIYLTRESRPPRAFSLTEPCSNNIAYYDALLIGFHLAQQMGVQYVEAYGDSKLIINQVKGKYEVHHEDLVPYHHAAIQLANTF